MLSRFMCEHPGDAVTNIIYAHVENGNPRFIAGNVTICGSMQEDAGEGLAESQLVLVLRVDESLHSM